MKKRLLVIFLVICILLLPINIYAIEIQATHENNSTEQLSNNEEAKFSLKYKKENQKVLKNSPQIGCKAAYVADQNTGKVLYEKNSHEVMYPASTTKILTALVVLENCKLTDKAVVSQNAIDLVPAGYSKADLIAGEELSILDLLYALLVPSANEAANVLAEHVSGSVEAFARVCNKRAKELGCENLHFVNPNGIHDNEHYCTAYDLYLIAKECCNYDIFKKIVRTIEYTVPITNLYSKNDRTFKNTNELLLKGTYNYPYCTGIKTGFTTPAGECLVASSTNHEIDLISVVLGGATNANGLNERFYDTKQLFDFVYNNYSIKKIANDDEIVATINVGKATKETASLDVILNGNISTVVPKDFTKEDILSSIDFNDNIIAPIEQNQVLGHITYCVDGLIYEGEVVASHSVEKFPYEMYNIIFVSIIVITLTTSIGLAIILKQHRIYIIILGVIILIIECGGIFFITKDWSSKAMTTTIINNTKN